MKILDRSSSAKNYFDVIKTSVLLKLVLKLLACG